MSSKIEPGDISLMAWKLHIFCNVSRNVSFEVLNVAIT